MKSPLDRFKHVEGQMHRAELMTLYGLARSLPPRANVVEIGSFRGKSTLAIAQGLTDGNGGVLYAIDPHPEYLIYGDEDRSALTRNVEESGLDNIRIIEDYSANVIESFNEPIHMLWIDGDHTYEGAKADFLNYTPLLVDGGVVALHDNQAPGPWHVVRSLMLRDDTFGDAGFCWSIIFARKGRGPTSIFNRWRISLYRTVYAAAATTAARLRKWQSGE